MASDHCSLPMDTLPGVPREQRGLAVPVQHKQGHRAQTATGTQREGVTCTSCPPACWPQVFAGRQARRRVPGSIRHRGSESGVGSGSVTSPSPAECSSWPSAPTKTSPCTPWLHSSVCSIVKTEKRGGKKGSRECKGRATPITPQLQSRPRLAREVGTGIFSSSHGWCCQSQLGRLSALSPHPPTGLAHTCPLVQASQSIATHPPGWVWPPSQSLQPSMASPGSGMRP